MILLSKKSVIYLGLVLALSLFLFANLAAGEEVEDKLSRIIRLRLGLDSNVYRVIETEYQGEKIVLVVIFGNEKAQNSSLGPDIKSGLREYKGKSPVAISVLTRDRDVRFQPYALRIIQDGKTSHARKIIGITEGFKEGKLPEKVPIEGKVFWGSKGIITLGSSFDQSTPFGIKYGSESANFALAPSGKAKPDVTPAPADQNGREDKQIERPTSKSEPPTAREEVKDNRKPPVSRSSSRSGRGLALFAQLGTLLAITFSLL